MMIIRIIDGGNGYDDYNDDDNDDNVKIIPMILMIKTSSTGECSHDIRVGGAVTGGEGRGVGGRQTERQRQTITVRKCRRMPPS